MDKINAQKFNLSINKSDSSKADDVLGALFSIPDIISEKKDIGKNMPFKGTMSENISKAMLGIKEKEIICILVSHEEINSYGQVEARSYNLS